MKNKKVMEVYVVKVSGKMHGYSQISSECYTTLDAAIKFIKSRADNPVPHQAYKFSDTPMLFDGKANVYTIRVLTVVDDPNITV